MGYSAGPLVSIEAHLAEVLASVRPLLSEAVGLEACLDRVLSTDVSAAVSIPGFDNSAMDGYAVHAEAVASASPQSPVRLRVVADLPAGQVHEATIAVDEAVRIMTGAALPPPGGGEDSPLTIVPVEDTDAGVGEVLITAPSPVGRHIRRAGEDVVAGELLLHAGQRITPSILGLLAAVGVARPRVSTRPRVLVLATGDELVEPGKPLNPGQLYESNGYQLAALVTAAGAVPVRPARVPDDAASLIMVLQAHLPQVDLVLTSGGVSAGAYDTVKAVLSSPSASSAFTSAVTFRKVAMQPGMPQGCGVLRHGGASVPIITLPGNPVSTYVSFEVFARPALAALTGCTQPRLELIATARAGWRSPAGKRQFTRVQLDFEGTGAFVSPVGGQHSHLVADLAFSNALAVIAEEVTEVRPGDQVTVWPMH